MNGKMRMVNDSIYALKAKSALLYRSGRIVDAKRMRRDAGFIEKAKKVIEDIKAFARKHKYTIIAAISVTAVSLTALIAAIVKRNNKIEELSKELNRNAKRVIELRKDLDDAFNSYEQLSKSRSESRRESAEEIKGLIAANKDLHSTLSESKLTYNNKLIARESVIKGLQNALRNADSIKESLRDELFEEIKTKERLGDKYRALRKILIEKINETEDMMRQNGDEKGLLDLKILRNKLRVAYDSNKIFAKTPNVFTAKTGKDMTKVLGIKGRGITPLNYGKRTEMRENYIAKRMAEKDKMGKLGMRDSNYVRKLGYLYSKRFHDGI